ncbi:glycosyltransferase family 2 protein [Psychroflexus sediminis]|uniref:Glycosyltransferase, GT2 family n=1 Tax=Psychroflexus sediminis TaxID=470826 RepID=A0A1G7ZFF1_9FLAO|nr:glycosyltransferase [Psychroflexus sediminis]SDH06810.1 Glycosyltransferase, GT2 family [Psychroflexus sediminis]
MPNPKVSIIIPTYNGAEYLQEALESIKGQTFRDFEVVVSDDDSKDDTLRIVERFKEKCNFPVRIFHHKPDGIGANWNHAMRQARGKYIKFLFQDDILLPACLEEMYTVLENNPKIGLVTSKREFIISKHNDDKTKQWLATYGDLQKHISDAPGDLILTKKLFKRKDFIKTPKNKVGEPSAVMFRKSIIDKLGYFDESLKQILDYEYWNRILKTYDIYILDKSLVKFRLHNAQATAQNANLKINDYQLYPQLLYKDYFWLLNYKYQKEFFFKYNSFGQLLKKIKRRVL